MTSSSANNLKKKGYPKVGQHKPTLAGMDAWVDKDQQEYKVYEQISIKSTLGGKHRFNSQSNHQNMLKLNKI